MVPFLFANRPLLWWLRFRLSDGGLRTKGKNMLDFMMMPLKRYAEFSGRSRRKEFWSFWLATLIAGIIAGVIDGILGLTGFISLRILVQLAILVPSIAVAIRRMHDQDRSGWWILCPIANIIFLFIEGTKGSNRFGPDPKDPGSAATFE